MKQLVFLLEEPSMREVLRVVLPQVLPAEISFLLIAHEGKQDLERSIPRKLRAWQNPEACFVVLRDQDSADCLELKRRLCRLSEAGSAPRCLVRIVCRELESWFLGNLKAVSYAFNLPNLAKLQNKEKFRNPDRLANAAVELQRLVRGYQKLSGARAIAQHLDLESNRSRSFQIFLAGLRRMIAELMAPNHSSAK